MTFDIGSQNAGVINNVAGDQHVGAGQEGNIVSIDAARRAVEDLRKAIVAAPLTPAAASAASAHAEVVAAEMRKDTPNRQNVADRISRLAGLLTPAASVATATASIAPIQTLMTWLGHLGAG